MTQNERVYRHLEEVGYITPLDALSEYGIMRLASRISDLKKSGVDIEMELIPSKNRFGDSTHYAKYTLKKSDRSAGTETITKAI